MLLLGRGCSSSNKGARRNGYSKNLGLSMEFIDYDWDDIAGTFVKEGFLGADFSFSTKTDLFPAPLA